MNRVRFTKAAAKLLSAMIYAEERPIIDWVKRSDHEQARLFKDGKSKCDGKKNVSKHQRGKAIDIYFVSEDGKALVEPKKGYSYWHRVWVEMGGKPMISWDKGHFEG